MSVNLEEQLFANREEQYKEFTGALIPGARPIIGVRLPLLRKMAKEVAKGDWKEFLSTGPENYFEEVQVKGFVIGYAKGSYEELLPYIRNHVEKINDWSLCDSFCSSLKLVEKHREAFLTELLLPLAKQDEEFHQRVAAVLLMDYYLTEEYTDRALEILDSLKNGKYYCKMAVAWAVATAWTKQREKTCRYLQPGNNTLDDWTYNKAIQKMLESYRVSQEDKDMLRKMKRK